MEFVSWESIPKKFRSNLRKVFPKGEFKEKTDEIVKALKTSVAFFDRTSNMCWYIFVNSKSKNGYSMYKYYQPNKSSKSIKVI